MIRVYLSVLVLNLLLAGTVCSQTSAFTFQGKLNDSGAPANANLDIQFRLFDAPSGTGQIGSTQLVSNVPVFAGIFTVQLDFGASSFSGDERFIEISISPASQNNFTTLAPRQRLTSAPYSVQSLKAMSANNSLNLGGVPADQYVLTMDARLSDARVPLPGSNDYVQNNTNAPQPGVNFNIGGTGSANILNAQTQFNLGGVRVIKQTGTASLFVGGGSGLNTTGVENSFFGVSAGSATTTGFGNSFFGHAAAFTNTTGSNNSHFGNAAGTALMGSGNSFVGKRAGGNVGGTGDNNTFIGIETNFDLSDGTGSNNTLLGANSRIDFNTSGQQINFATAIGADAAVSASNTVMLGRSLDTVQVPGALNVAGTFGANILNATTQLNIGGNRVLSNGGTDNLFAGIGAGTANSGARNAFFGHLAGNSNTSGNSNAFFGSFAGSANTIGGGNSFFGRNAGSASVTGNNNTFIGNDSNFNTANPTGINNTLLGAFTQVSSGVSFSTAIGEGAQVTQSSSLILGRSDVRVGIGTTAPATKLHIKGDAEGIRIQGSGFGIENGAYVSFADAAGTQIGYVGDGSSGDNSLYLTSYNSDVILYTQAGAGLRTTSTGRVIVPAGQGAGFFPAFEVAPSLLGGSVIANNLYIRQFNELGSPAHLCWRASNIGLAALVVTTCTAPFGSSQFKTDFRPFTGGIDIISRLNPISFRWKEGGASDVGLNAEDVAEVEPSLVTRNAKGEVEDVNEHTLDILFINAIKEQQKQLVTQRELIRQQEQQIEAMKKLVCGANPLVDFCKEGR